MSGSTSVQRASGALPIRRDDVSDGGPSEGGFANLQPPSQTEIAALPAAAVLAAGLPVADIVAVGAVAWVGAVLLNNPEGAKRAGTRMIADITDRLQWTRSQGVIAQQEMNNLLRNARVSSISSITHLKEQILGAVGTLQHRFSSKPAAAVSAARAHGVRTRSSRSLAASHHPTQTNIAPTRPRPPNALLYKAKTQPVALPIHTARASSEPRRYATMRTAPAKPTVAAAAVTVPARIAIGTQVDRRTAAVDAAVQAIGEWGRLARQWAELPTNASPERREELAALVMSAGQQLQQALVQPDVVQVMKASGTGGDMAAAASSGSAAAASPSPNGEAPRGGGNRDPNGGNGLKQRLLEAVINAAASGAGDLLEHVTGGAQLSPEKLVKGTFIAATVGFIMPASLRGPVRGSLINGAASGIEAFARQKSGIDPEDPAAVVASFFFAAGLAEGLHRLHRLNPFFRRPPAILPSEAPKVDLTDLRERIPSEAPKVGLPDLREDIPKIVKDFTAVEWANQDKFVGSLEDSELDLVLNFLRNNLAEADVKQLRSAWSLLLRADKVKGAGRALSLNKELMARAANTPIHPQSWVFPHEFRDFIQSYWFTAFAKLLNGDSRMFNEGFNTLAKLYGNAPASQIHAHFEVLKGVVAYDSVSAIEELMRGGEAKRLMSLPGERAPLDRVFSEVGGVEKNSELLLVNLFYQFLSDARTAEVWWLQGGGFHNTERINSALVQLQKICDMIEGLGAKRTDLSNKINFAFLRVLFEKMKVNALARRGIDNHIGVVGPLQAIGIEATDAGTIGNVGEVYDRILGIFKTQSFPPSKIWDSLPKVFYMDRYH
ncbi:MAG: hypothetical protein NTW15_21965 [Burkholderiales bacterium]|nr:hypothetical protein [Burkholderiales bacterium]